MQSLALTAAFKEIPLKDYDINLKYHPAREKPNLESINTLTELIGKIQDTNSNSQADIVTSEKQTANLITLFEWAKGLQIG